MGELRGPCRAGHPVTPENTQHIGAAGYRCKECRRKLARESAKKMRALDPEKHRRNDAKYRAAMRVKATLLAEQEDAK